MSPRRRPVMGSSPTTQGYARLEQKLALLNWLHRQLGYNDTLNLLRETKGDDKGFDANVCSHINTLLETQSEHLHGLTVHDLQRYDDNIRCHLKCMNQLRPEPIALRYFQYLAALYSEIYLDYYFNRHGNLLRSLNEFVAEYNSNSTSYQQYEEFDESDLSKLAFWMATGSGKTLLLHLNYRQFLHYKGGAPDNILLITPNEGLSQQHLDELHASDIPAMRFDVNQAGTLLTTPKTIKVTEITKLVDEKKGGGVRVPVETLEGDNLIFVDEGHKGAGGKAWRAMRDQLAETGFTFEYSATFGQALAAAKNDALLTEYGKAIAFDYSYRHFYEDGYGKDFNILNLQKVSYRQQTDTLLMANLLSFYEQQLVFAQQSAALKPYNLARPLWTFVGGSVNAVYQKSKKPRSDILTVARFLQRVLSDKVWATDTIDLVLSGQSNLKIDKSGRDIFAHRFETLRRLKQSADTTYRNALRRVMHTDGGGLQLHDLKGCEGEIGLKSAGGNDYFGVIYIGDTSSFKKLVEADDSGIVISDDLLHGSLFERINEPDSTIEILTGARKFMEGWNSWRVSNMGLLNIGKSEGSLIIQLFGRGVRLKGREMSLKRSSALGNDHPADIKLLETLNIFALRADYMAQFREYLQSEGILEHESIELPLFIQTSDEFLDQGLLIPRLDEGRKFANEETVLLKHQEFDRPVSVEMSTTVQEISSAPSGVTDVDATSGIEQTIPPQSLHLVDWDSVYLALLEYKQARNMSNLLVRPELLRPILEAKPPPHRLVAEQSVVEPRSYQDRRRLQEAVINILRAYADSLYRHRLAQWESDNLTYRELDHTDDNFLFNVGEEEGKGTYFVRVPKDNEELIEHVEKLIAECKDLYRGDRDELPRIHFDRHLYQPLLIEAEGVTSSPQGLRESEFKFVSDLKDYCENAPADDMSGTELYLLRNLSRGKGVGFFDNIGFYPDFILWVKSEEAQRIVFIEPHGMLYAKAYAKDDKAQLHERLPELSRKIANRSGNPKVQLDSYIISATKFQDLKDYYDNGKWTEDDFAAKYILFQEPEIGYSYIEKILQP